MHQAFFSKTKPAIVVRGPEDQSFIALLEARLRDHGCDVTVIGPDDPMPDWDAVQLISWVPEGEAQMTTLRWLSEQCPFIALMASQAAADRMAALNAGAEDVLSAPIDIDECMLRTAIAMHRRHAMVVIKESSGQLQVDNLWMHQDTHQVRVDDQAVKLTPIQFELLWLLAQHKDTTLSKSLLYRQVLKKRLRLMIAASICI
ncbi:response regulator transcription factor [Salinivibrio costicola]|uniref:response regulator transcription factor n=1 Tax=Salinivibrio costicola TaxID=51367 RepID=UPI003F6F2F17